MDDPEDVNSIQRKNRDAMEVARDLLVRFQRIDDIEDQIVESIESDCGPDPNNSKQSPQ
jgi:hypothetical protein